MNISITIWTLFAFISPFTFAFWLFQLLCLYKVIKNSDRRTHIGIFLWSAINIVLFDILILHGRIADNIWLIYLMICIINMSLFEFILSFRKERTVPIDNFFIPFSIFIVTNIFSFPWISMFDGVYYSAESLNHELFSMLWSYLAINILLIWLYLFKESYYKNATKK